MIKNGQPRLSVRMVTRRDPRDLYQPTNKCTKIGRFIINILSIKHPNGIIADGTHFNTCPKDVSEECQTSMLVYYSEDEVAKAANTLDGCVGPTGVDEFMLKGRTMQKAYYLKNSA